MFHPCKLAHSVKKSFETFARDSVADAKKKYI